MAEPVDPPQVPAMILDAFSRLSAVATYAPPESATQVFTKFHSWIAAADVVPRLRGAGDESRIWYVRLADSTLGDTQNAVAAVFYHLERAGELERRIAEIIRDTALRELLPRGATIAGGDTRVIDFEYHAMLYAWRRALDYLSRGIAAYFRQDGPSFKKLPKLLRAANHPVATHLLPVIEEQTSNAAEMLSGEGFKSIRDRLTHYRFVSAGTLNVHADGWGLYGGEWTVDGVRTFHDRLTARANLLVVIVDSVLTALSDADRAAYPEAVDSSTT
jgi:hypothetical protein